MARRASSRVPTRTVLLCGAALLLILGIGAYFLGGFGNPFRALQPLDADVYLENANSLRGNVYRLDGTVQNALAWSPTKGRLISVDLGGDDTKDRGSIVAVFIPSKFNQVNLQKGQRYHFKVEVVKDGVIEVSDLRKS
ncbi:MAG: hypothetical protein PW734_08090 [Verrucomicrobium sp.]|nr:hypothetical protein [Verrucomicrobium sp.]